MKTKFKKGTETLVEKLSKEATRAPELRRLQSVLLGCKGLTAEMVSSITGLKPNYIRQVWMKCRREGVNSLIGEARGQNRGKAHLTLDEEFNFLKSFEYKAQKGQLVTTKQIHEAHGKLLQRNLNPTLTHRLLHRHGWRKIAPRPTHPKHDPEKMKTFKEAIFPPGYDPYKD